MRIREQRLGRVATREMDQPREQTEERQRSHQKRRWLRKTDNAACAPHAENLALANLVGLLTSMAAH